MYYLKLCKHCKHIKDNEHSMGNHCDNPKSEHYMQPIGLNNACSKWTNPEE